MSYGAHKQEASQPDSSTIYLGIWLQEILPELDKLVAGAFTSSSF